MSKLVRYEREITGAVGVAEDVGYNNVSSGLEASNVQEAIDEINGDLTNSTVPVIISPPEYAGHITFTKIGKNVNCDISDWNCPDGQVGQVVPVELRPSVARYGVAYKSGSPTPIAVRYYNGYIQFLDVGITSYVAGTMYGHLEWVLN